ncbi:MAG: GLPGLI family protein [Bacteroidaceae bacterium]|nr:GLPGLI family protein [Bacteroidaceae bacterium]
MKAILFLLAFVLVLTAQAQETTLDTTLFTAVYDYQLQTLDADGVSVCDQIPIAVRIGSHVTHCTLFCPAHQEGNVSIETLMAQEQMHFPQLWLNYPEGQTTTHERILPNTFVGIEPTPTQDWALSPDTLTLAGYLCHAATTTFRGLTWHVWYTDEIPSSTGPWKLHGLPGLIVRAESDAHTFTLSRLITEAEPITYSDSPDFQKMKQSKLTAHKNKVYGDRRYLQQPTYYVPDLLSTVTHVEVFNLKDGSKAASINGYFLPQTVHVYQPLEKTSK